MSDKKKNIGSEELEQAQGGTPLPLAGGAPKSMKRRDGTRDGTHDLEECGPPPGMSNDDKDTPPDPLKPHS